MGPTENFHDNEKRSDTTSASRDLLCSNNFEVLLRTIRKQVSLTENDNKFIQEKQALRPALNNKLSQEVLVFVPKMFLQRGMNQGYWC